MGAMLWFVIFITGVFLFSGINNYLLLFSASGKLPAAVGFNIFAKFGHIAIIVMSIWSLGWIIGTLFFAFYLFNLLNASLSWVITYVLISKSITNNTEHKLNTTVYGLFSFLTIAIVLFAIISFFIIPHKGVKEELEYGDYKVAFVMGVLCLIGFVLRRLVMKSID